MSVYEIISSLGVASGIMVIVWRVWTKTQIDIAKIYIHIETLRENSILQKAELDAHKLDNERRFEQLHRENREDHQIMFKKLDNLKVGSSG